MNKLADFITRKLYSTDEDLEVRTCVGEPGQPMKVVTDQQLKDKLLKTVEHLLIRCGDPMSVRINVVQRDVGHLGFIAKDIILTCDNGKIKWEDVG